MKKVRANALWNELSPENRKILDTWLFEKNMSYAKILPKARSELGFKGSVGSLCRYRKRRELERMLTDIDQLTGDAKEIVKGGVKRRNAERGEHDRVQRIFVPGVASGAGTSKATAAHVQPDATELSQRCVARDQRRGARHSATGDGVREGEAGTRGDEKAVEGVEAVAAERADEKKQRLNLNDE